MPRVPLGVILGLSFGIADVLLMLPLSFPDKRTALLAAFSSGVVPLQSIADVDGAPDVVAIAIALASQDVDESRAGGSHLGGKGVYRAKASGWKY